MQQRAPGAPELGQQQVGYGRSGNLQHNRETLLEALSAKYAQHKGFGTSQHMTVECEEAGGAACHATVAVVYMKLRGSADTLHAWLC